jgi:photosystem II stability/assembly factor-like uncharacterized protein
MRLLLFSLVSLFLLITGCDKHSDSITTPQVHDSGSILLKIDSQNKPENVTSVKAALTRPGYNPYMKHMNLLTDSTADVNFTEIAAGLWHLKVDAYDSTEIVVYSGEADVDILAGTTIQVTLTLVPVSSGVGNIYILVTWGISPAGWKTIASGTNSNLQTIYFVDSQTGWCGGSDGRILKSTNGGNTWIVQNSGTAKRINWIHFLDQNRGFAVGESGVFLRTDNGGINWNPVVNVTNFSLYHISFIGETGWITGYPGVIYKTTNAGNNWFLLNSTTTYGIYSSYFLNLEVGFVSGQSGLIMKTTNGGNSWSDAGSCSCWGWLQSIKFIDDYIGIAAGGNGSIIRTSNGGVTWNAVNSGTIEHLEDLSFPSASLGFVVGDHGTIKQTTDRGQTWIPEVKLTNQWLNGSFFLNTNNGWAVGNNGVILKYNN